MDCRSRRRAETRAFECFQLATGYIVEENKKPAVALIRKAVKALEPYDSPVKAGLQELLATLEGRV